jgi:hypothetical protein
VAAIFELPPVGRATVELCCELLRNSTCIFSRKHFGFTLGGGKTAAQCHCGSSSHSAGLGGTRRESISSTSSLHHLLFFLKKKFISTGKLIDFGSRVCSVFFGIQTKKRKNCSCLHGGGKEKILFENFRFFFQ